MYQMALYRDSEARYHYRRIYGILELMGDVGGLNEGVCILLGFVLFPVSQHSYIV